ncbi:hypothetical protein K5D48_12585 [Pseudomonas cichorii]|nr:hypothetical protein [Pseudomonas cichorii]
MLWLKNTGGREKSGGIFYWMGRDQEAYYFQHPIKNINKIVKARITLMMPAQHSSDNFLCNSRQNHTEPTDTNKRESIITRPKVQLE